MDTLRGATEASLHAFALISDQLSDHLESATLLDLQEELDRVKVWAGNLGVFAKGHSALEWRLRDADLMRSTILTLHGLLRKTLLEIVETHLQTDPIVDLSNLDYDASDVISLPSDDEDETLDLAAAEIDSLVLTVVELVNNLYRLSFKIRTSKARPSRAKFYKEIDADSGLELFDSFYAKFDRDHIFGLLEDLRTSFKAVDNDETLLDRLHRTNCDFDFSTKIMRTGYLDSDNNIIALRLATGNTTRRRKFRYWSKHADKLAAVEESLQANQKFSHQGDLGKSIYTTTEATEVITEIHVANLENESVASVAITAYDLEGNVASLPPPPKLASEGKDFICPYCHVLCPSRHGSGRVWRAHVIRDLEPYVCTYANCSSGDGLYGSRADWLDHENEKHRAVWKCNLHSTLQFSTEASLKEHFRLQHTMSVDQINELAQTSRFSSEDKRTECPICLQSAKDIPKFSLHIANHLERIANFSLPRNMDLKEDSLTGSKEAVEKNGSNRTSWQSGSLGDSGREASSDSNPSHPTDEQVTDVQPEDVPDSSRDKQKQRDLEETGHSAEQDIQHEDEGDDEIEFRAGEVRKRQSEATEEKWYSVFSLLFPGAEKPASPCKCCPD